MIRNLNSYGGKFDDALVLMDPTVEQASNFANRLHCDTSQMTHTSTRAWVRFTTSSGGNGVISPTSGHSHMGVDTPSLPTVTKTGTGVYTVVYPASYTDELDELENIVLLACVGSLGGVGQRGKIITTITAATTVTVELLDASNNASDLAGTAIVTVLVFS